MKNKYPMVSIIVVSFNKKNHIGTSLDAVIGQNYPYFETIAFDNGSNEETKEFVTEHYPR